MNTDDLPRLEFEAPRRLFAARRATLIASIDRRRDLRRVPDELRLAGWLRRHPLTPAGAEALFVTHTTYPGSPASWRLSLVDELIASSATGFLVDLLFTLDREGHSDHAARVEARLLATAADTPRALYAVALSRSHQPGSDADDAETRRLLDRCLALGDDPHARCAQLLRTLDP